MEPQNLALAPPHDCLRVAEVCLPPPRRWRALLLARMMVVAARTPVPCAYAALRPEPGSVPFGSKAGAASTAVVSIEPASQQVTPRGRATASIVISGVVHLNAADVRLKVNPAILAVVDANAGQTRVQIAPGPLLTMRGPNQIFTNQVGNTASTPTATPTDTPTPKLPPTCWIYLTRIA